MIIINFYVNSGFQVAKKKVERKKISSKKIGGSKCATAGHSSPTFIIPGWVN